MELFGHNFISFEQNNSLYEFFKCDKCSIVVFASHSMPGKYVMNDGPSMFLDYNGLTCEEIIIKNIIE